MPKLLGHNGPPADPSGPPAPKARNYVTPAEAKLIFTACGQAGRNGVRDKALAMCMYHHGLRVREALSWRWHDIQWTTGQVHVGRVKGGRQGTHPIPGIELRVLRALKKEAGDNDSFVFLSERGGPMSPDSVARVLQRAGETAELGFHLHPHMLRHGCGYKLANEKQPTRTIQAYLGHSQISSTTIYTTLAADAFRGLFPD